MRIKQDKIDNFVVRIHSIVMSNSYSTEKNDWILVSDFSDYHDNDSKESRLALKMII